MRCFRIPTPTPAGDIASNDTVLTREKTSVIRVEDDRQEENNIGGPSRLPVVSTTGIFFTNQSNGVFDTMHGIIWQDIVLEMVNESSRERESEVSRVQQIQQRIHK